MKVSEMSWTGSKHWGKCKYIRNFNWKPGVREHSSDVDKAWRITLDIVVSMLRCETKVWTELVKEVRVVSHT
jgi:hypothetical protein